MSRTKSAGRVTVTRSFKAHPKYDHTMDHTASSSYAGASEIELLMGMDLLDNVVRS